MWKYQILKIPNLLENLNIMYKKKIGELQDYQFKFFGIPIFGIFIF